MLIPGAKVQIERLLKSSQTNFPFLQIGATGIVRLRQWGGITIIQLDDPVKDSNGNDVKLITLSEYELGEVK